MSRSWWVLGMDEGVRSGPHDTKRAAVAAFVPAGCPRRVHRFGPGAYEVSWHHLGDAMDGASAFVERLDPDDAAGWQWALDVHLNVEDDYAAVTDELNDGSPHDVTLDDLDPRLVARARRYASGEGLSWPPNVGDFDRYCERKWEQQRRERRAQ